jgi:hypothetical protein
MKTHFIGTLVLSFLFFNFTDAQYWTACGGRASSMGKASVALSDTWSVNNNPAGMAFAKKASAGLYVENHYFLKDLSNQVAAFTQPTRSGVFGSSIQYSGNSIFNTMNAGLAYARLFGNQVATGIKLDILRTSLSEGYGTSTCGTFEVGMQLLLANKLFLGVHIFNPLYTRLSKNENEKIPAIMRTGLTYSYSGALSISTELKKNSENPLEFLTGLEYKFSGKGFIRMGFSTAPFTYSFGVGYVIRQLSIDISSCYHEILGISPQASLQYTFEK